MDEAFEKWWEDFVALHEDWRFADSEALRKQAFRAGMLAAADICEQQMLHSDWPRTPNDCAEAIREVAKS
jgi:hypothetical protein